MVNVITAMLNSNNTTADAWSQQTATCWSLASARRRRSRVGTKAISRLLHWWTGLIKDLVIEMTLELSKKDIIKLLSWASVVEMEYGLTNTDERLVCKLLKARDEWITCAYNHNSKTRTQDSQRLKPRTTHLKISLQSWQNLRGSRHICSILVVCLMYRGISLDWRRCNHEIY